MTKTCTKCGETHPATTEYFYKDNRNKIGLQAWCKKCRIVYEKERNRKKQEERKTREKEAETKPKVPKFRIGQGVKSGQRYGRVSGVFKHFVVVDFKRYKESILYADIYCGDKKIN